MRKWDGVVEPPCLSCQKWLDCCLEDLGPCDKAKEFLAMRDRKDKASSQTPKRDCMARIPYSG